MNNKIDTLIKAAYHYYVLNKPIMSDVAYDKLYEEVKKLEDKLDIPIKDRITERLNLGYFEGKQQHKIEHPIPMLSLNKEVKETEKDVIVTPKLDGVALELIYRQGVLYAKVTRGDGKVGGDVTKIPIKDIPSEVEKWKNKDLVVVRGEVVCDNWEGATHRNWVAGSLGLIDLKEAEKRGLRFVAYFLYPVNETFEDDLRELEEVGFIIPPYVKLENTLNMEAEDYNFFEDYEIPTDGVVVRFNYNGNFGQHTSKAYKNMWAVKFQDDVALTEILTVEWKQSKNNVWTPVAIIDPVIIDGTTIERVNLASLDYIAEKDIAIGDLILVRKAKGVIPEIAEVVERPKDRVKIGLKRCPACNSELIKEGIYLKCKNVNCGVLKKIAYFTKELKIKGLGEKRLEKLNLKSPLEIFTISEKKLVEKLGKVGYDIYNEIQEVKEKSTLIDLIVALNPPMVKRAMLELIFQNIEDLEDLGDTEKLISIKGIGEVRATAFVAWYNDNKLLLEEFKKLGFKIEKPKAKTSYKKIAVTGSYYRMTRDQFKKFIEQVGYTIVSKPSSKCEALVVGDKPSQSKIEQANKLGLPILTYEDFLLRLKNERN